MISKTNLTHVPKPAQHLIMGFTGYIAPKWVLNLIHTHDLLGIVLFRRNFKSPEQFKILINDLRQAHNKKNPYPLLIAVDQEGGTVQRFPEILPWLPSPKYCETLSEKVFFHTLLNCTHTMAKWGINLNFAPVLDTLPNKHVSPIGMRSYSHSFKTVSSLGKLCLKAHAANQIFACAKHFPGLGSASKDSHFVTPLVKKNHSLFTQEDLIPFKHLIHAKIPFLMTSHAHYKAFPGTMIPASFNADINTALLRNKLNFKGLLISDDLCMESISNRPLLHRIHDCLSSGVDIALVCHPEAFWIKTTLQKHLSSRSAQEALSSTQKTARHFAYTLLNTQFKRKKTPPLKRFILKPEQYTLPSTCSFKLSNESAILCFYISDKKYSRYVEENSLKEFSHFITGLNHRFKNVTHVFGSLNKKHLSLQNHAQTIVIIPRYTEQAQSILLSLKVKWHVAIFCRDYKPLPEHKHFCHNALFPWGFGPVEQEATLRVLI